MTDFKLNADGDLEIGTDLASTESTNQHQVDIIWSQKGWWHFSPPLGVGLQQWINESGTSPGLARVIRQECERDGMTVESVRINGDGIEVNATYIE